MKVRLAAVAVRPVVMIDDGENLTPQQVTEMTVSASQVDELPALLRNALTELQTQLDNHVASQLEGQLESLPDS